MVNITPCGQDGNIGFPYTFTGDIGNVTLSTLQLPLHFSFGSTMTTPTLQIETGYVSFSSSLTNTIIYNDTTYTMNTAQLCQAQSLWSTVDATIVGELIFTFITNNKNTTNPLIIILSYLLKKNVNYHNCNLLKSIFTRMPSSKSMSITELSQITPAHYVYTTCIPLKETASVRGLRALCVIGEMPIMIPPEYTKSLTLTKYKLPSTLISSNNGKTILSYTTDNYGNMVSNVTSDIYNTYSNSILVTDASFKTKFFKYIYNPSPSVTKSVTSSGGYTRLDQLKCYPIKQKNDINGELLLIDPATGKPMDKYLAESNAEMRSMDLPAGDVQKKNNTFAIVFGIIAALIILALIVFFAIQYTHTSVSVPDIKVTANVSLDPTNPTNIK
jgi:hypothetical protein